MGNLLKKINDEIPRFEPLNRLRDGPGVVGSSAGPSGVNARTGDET